MTISALQGHCQRHEVEFTTAYGGVNTAYGFLEAESLITLPYHPLTKYMSLGLGGRYRYFEESSKSFGIGYTVGLFYHLKATNELQQLHVPIGFNSFVGNTVQFRFGAGLNPKFHLSSQSYYAFRFAQIGCYFELGLGVKISQQLGIHFGYQMTYDLTGRYKNAQTLPIGVQLQIDEKEYEGTLRLGLTCTIRKSDVDD